MIIAIEILVVAFGALALVRSMQNDRVVRRDALLEGARVLRQRAATKWEKDPNAAIEAGNCAAALERMAGAAPTIELRQEVAA